MIMVILMFTKVYERIKIFIKENYKFFLALVFIFVFFFYELPFVIYRPGGTIDLEKRVTVENGYPSEGTLSMSYVSMMRGNIPFVLLSFIIPNWDLVESNKITMENESLDDSIQRDKIYLEEGLDSATISAYRLAGKEITIFNTHQIITYIDSSSDTNLKVGDMILNVDGKELQNVEDLKSYINTLNKGKEVHFQVNREGKLVDCYATVYEMEGSLKVGIAVSIKYDYTTNPPLKIETKESESGSSGGLMTALYIYNALVEEDITKGKNIVGTGTIDIEGNVGEIGGIKYKLLGAMKKHADYFLCPLNNYEEAKEIKEKQKLKLNLIPVKTLEEAVEALKNVS